MIATRAPLLAALGLGCGLACNALLDNEPRHFVAPGSSGGEGGAAGHEGSTGAGGTGTEDAAGAAGTAAPSGGEGGAPACDCALEHATSRCRDGACEIVACQAGFIDANSMPADGCETGDVPSEALLLWFMADRGLSLNGDQVSAWVDQSAAHVTATPGSAEAMPKRVQRAAGPPLVEFDGADDGLKLPEGFSTFNGATFIAVAEAYPAEVCAGILSLSNGNDDNDIEFGRHTKNLLYYEVLGSFVEGATNAFEANERLLVSITQSSTGAVELRINGVLNASPKTIALPKVVVRTQNFLGRDTYTACPQAYKGLLGELVLFSRGVSSEEYARIQSYLAGKWAIPVATP